MKFCCGFYLRAALIQERLLKVSLRYMYPSTTHVHFSSLLELPDITQSLKESKMHSTRYQIDYHIFFLNVVQITTLVNISLSLKLPKSGNVFAVSSLILNEIIIHASNF